MTAERIPVTRPWLGVEENEAVARVLESGYLVQGARIAAFEALVAEWVGTPFAVAVSNCTAALRVSLMALGVGAGDRVAVTPYSWVTTSNVIELCGAEPVFVDIDPATFNMDPDRLGDLLQRDSSIAAVLPVHTFGNPAGIGQIGGHAASAGIPMIEDAACALGATLDGAAAGSIGAVGCFSFHPRKIITTGEGGMIVTRDANVAEFARRFRNHGIGTVDGAPAFVDVGDNLRMTDVQGAIGEVQMGRLADLVAQRGALASAYDDAIAPLGFQPQRRASGAVVQSYVALTPEGVAAGVVIDFLRSRNIEATVGTTAIPFSVYHRRRFGLSELDLPNTATVDSRAVTLPLFPGMTEDQLCVVVDALAQFAT